MARLMARLFTTTMRTHKRFTRHPPWSLLAKERCVRVADVGGKVRVDGLGGMSVVDRHPLQRAHLQEIDLRLRVDERTGKRLRGDGRRHRAGGGPRTIDLLGSENRRATA